MFGRFKAFSFKKRPDIDAQNTGHEAFQRVTGLAFTPANGGAGIVFGRSPSPFNPGTVMVGPSHKVNDPTVTGNNAVNLTVAPLSDPMANLIGSLTAGNI